MEERDIPHMKISRLYFWYGIFGLMIYDLLDVFTRRSFMNWIPSSCHIKKNYLKHRIEY